MDSKLLRLDLEMQFFSPAVMDILTIVHKKGRKGGREGGKEEGRKEEKGGEGKRGEGRKGFVFFFNIFIGV